VQCPSCGFEQSLLEPGIGDTASHEAIDEGLRASGLNALREINFARIITILTRLRPARGRILEVGCGHGWFLHAATREGWSAIGIEPDRAIATSAARRGATVRLGTYPEAIEPGETFDAIVFNDVFEHLPDVQAAMKSSAAALRPGGVLVVNLPDARGVLYRFSRLLARLGLPGPFERLWQKGFPSPHLSYFTGPLLRRLAEQNGFVPLHQSRLQSVSLSGLWQRIRYDRQGSVLKALVAFLGVCGLYPWLRLLPSDIWLAVFEKPERTLPRGVCSTARPGVRRGRARWPQRDPTLLSAASTSAEGGAPCTERSACLPSLRRCPRCPRPRRRRK
jgi:SAM-dependent methyltransferase